MPEGNRGSLAAGTMDAPARAVAIRRAAARLCLRWGVSPLHEVPLPNGRRADILALGLGESLDCIEVKSCARDFLADQKWPSYRDYCDRLYFAVDEDFPVALVPDDAGLIVVAAGSAELLREAPLHRLAPARRRALLARFAQLAAARLAALEDPLGAAELRAALLVE